jgi:hypothetical protein
MITGAGMPAFAGDDEFPIVGIYTKDLACQGEASKRPDLQVKITRQNIVSSMGSCAILNKRRNGRAFLLQVECKMAGDLTLLGDVTFTPRDDNTLDFDDQDHTSTSVLHRCGT